MKITGTFGRICAVLAVVLATIPQAALADDEPEEIGILAALGLQAADGKTTLGTGAGTIEATLLSSDSVNEAGAIIAGLVNSHSAYSGRDGIDRVLVLTGSETANLLNLRLIRSRVRYLARLVGGLSCVPAAADEEADPETLTYSGAFGGAPNTFLFSDAAGLLATTTNYAAITIKIEERILLNSMMLNSGLSVEPSGQVGHGPATWQTPRWGRPFRHNPVTYVIPSEAHGIEESGLQGEYQALVNNSADLRPCAERADVKPVLAVLDAFVTAINAVPADNQLSPLARAMQLDSAISVEQTTRILRIAVEASGGTTATRSSIWFTLGFPGAATVSSGLLISFRLIDYRTGEIPLAGVIRCAERFRNIRSVARIVSEPTRPGRRCTYIAGPGRT